MSDLISRKAILEHIEKIRQDALMMDDMRRASIIMNGMSLCEKAVMNQPSAQPDKDMIHLQKEQAYMQGWEDGRKALLSAQHEAIQCKCKDCPKREYCRTATAWAVVSGDDWHCADAERRADE